MERMLARRATPGDLARGGVTMHVRRARALVSRTWATPAALLCCLVFVPAAAANPAPLAKRTGYAKIVHACPQPKPHSASCDALVRVPVPSSDAGTLGVERYTLGDGDSESGPAGGLTPSDLASAYGYDPKAGGSGQTVAIVDAYDDPNIESDLAAFDSNYGLPACTKANGCFTKVSQTGSTTSLPEADTSGWSVEISLDVETVHSVCPECKILLVEAKNEDFKNLAAGVERAVAMKATEISNSYGGFEQPGGIEPAAYDHPGTVIAAATGDDGWDDWTFVFEGFIPPEAPNVPASLPTVVAVGGTTLELTAEGKRKSETVWNGNGPVDDSEFVEGATGGGCSTLFTAEPWQRDAPGFAASGCGEKRLAADVAAVADPNTGFDVYDTYNCGESCEEFKRGEDWVTIGGTSLSTPIVSALYALAGGSNGVSYPSLTLYGHLTSRSSLFDVTKGGSGFCDGAPESECGHPDAFGALAENYALDVDCEYTTACDAAVGYDGPSGVGTPDGLGLFKPLAPVAAITPPSLLRAKVAAAFSGAASSDPYPGGTISSYTWKWGDGSESTGVAPSHAFAVAGEYTVTLTVTDSYGFTSAPVTTTVNVPTTKEVEEEEAATKKKAEEEAAAKKKAEEEAAAKKKAEEEAAAKKKAEEEAAAKKKAEEEAAAKKKAEEEAAAKKKAEQEAEKKAEESIAKELAELQAEAEEQSRKQAEAQATAKKAEEARKKGEEEAAAAKAALAAQEVSAFHASLALAVPNAQIVGTSLKVSPSGALKLTISCPKGESTCLGTITLRTLTAVIADAGRTARAKAAVLTLASGSFSVPGGTNATITLHLSSKARVLLARVHTLRVRATLLAHDLQGAHHTSQITVVLHAPKPARHRG
jgi:PKD repeat protein